MAWRGFSCVYEFRCTWCLRESCTRNSVGCHFFWDVQNTRFQYNLLLNVNFKFKSFDNWLLAFVIKLRSTKYTSYFITEFFFDAISCHHDMTDFLTPVFAIRKREITDDVTRARQNVAVLVYCNRANQPVPHVEFFLWISRNQNESSLPFKILRADGRVSLWRSYINLLSSFF